MPSDRIAVMYKGHIIGVVDANKTSATELGLLMAGITSNVANVLEDKYEN